MSKPAWLNRRVAPPGPYLMLCLSEQEFEAALKRLKVQPAPPWVNKGASATTHTFEHIKHDDVCIVCLADFEGRSGVQIAGLLVHEAVHVWQNWCRSIGERQSGTEQEAYGIQLIAQELIGEFARRRGCKDG